MRARSMISVVLIIVLEASYLQFSAAGDILGCGGFIRSSIPIQFTKVEVKLYTKQGALKYTTDCAPNNGYYFLPVYEKGAYTLRIHPPKGWTFQQESIEVNIDGSSDPCSLGKDMNFIFVGFSVEGTVLSRGTTEGPTGVTVSLSPTSMTTVTGEGGKFQFIGVPHGEYVLKLSHSIWNVQKEGKKVIIVDDSVLGISGLYVEGNRSSSSNQIKVEGFSVSGRVLTSPNGEGISGARILLDGVEVMTTDINGVFRLETLKTGQYTLKATAEGMKFDEVVTAVSPKTPSLPDLIPTSFLVCVSLKMPQDVLDTSSIHVDPGIPCDAAAKCCSFLPSGVHELSPRIPPLLKQKGIVLVPVTQKVDLTMGPVTSGIVFSQFKGSIKGKVKCVDGQGPCGNLKLQLIRNEDGTSATTETTADGKFIFKELLPGNYELSLDGTYWCWTETSKSIDIFDQDIADVVFEHKGYKLTVEASHETMLEAIDEAGRTQTFNLAVGKDEICLEYPGTYKLIPRGCHKFEKAEYTWKSVEPDSVTLHAVEHLLTGVASGKNVTSVSVLENAREISPVAVDKEGRFQIWTVPGNEYIFIPKSKYLLFVPPEIRMKAEDDCMIDVANFQGVQGVFLNGVVVPPLADARVEVRVKEGQNEMMKSSSTGLDGKYIVGPLPKENKYDVVVVKEGYQLTEIESGRWKAMKLASIVVEAKEKDSGNSLDGAVVTLAGGDSQRENKLTNEDGKLTFWSLLPGEYFIRPILKEYKFTPTSQIVTLVEGQSVTVAFEGERVAYSVRGKIFSLTGEGEGGVSVKAVGSGTCSEALEEAVSESSGVYRLRGLHQDCQYTVAAGAGNDKSIPPSVDIQVGSEDTQGVNFKVIRRSSEARIEMTVFIRPEVTTSGFLEAITARLYADDAADTPTWTGKPAHSGGFLLLPPLPHDKNYHIRLESATYTDLPEIILPSSMSHISVVLPVKRKYLSDSSEQSPSGRGSSLVPVLAIFCVLIALAIKTRGKQQARLAQQRRT
ncbi:unnamed protein product [Cyprideis torosa]|uniref:Uncharacterized protein n=1 Tax=Cyprideis torosa TaxID=163714 RepID=A0A7R8ZI50_9CRUS|nr:unnamed protein product [Cyprideis torosa]CAG0885277.1 unnamed protein product [Cyprideis torosa]